MAWADYVTCAETLSEGKPSLPYHTMKDHQTRYTQLISISVMITSPLSVTSTPSHDH